MQAGRLAEVYTKYDYFYFTFSGKVAEALKATEKVRTIPNVVRYNPVSWFMGMLLSAYIAVTERPDVVITTGAGVVVFLCIFAKMCGAKIIFLESMAKVNRPTLTARLLYPFADMFLVQWPQLLRYFPKAQYLGRLF